MSYLAAALIGHLVGDYLLQNDWMAAHKKQWSHVAAVHAAVWTLCVCVFGFILSPIAIGWLFATHFLIDRFGLARRYMRLMGQEGFASGALSPWSIIVVDNVIHLVTIWLVFVL